MNVGLAREKLGSRMSLCLFQVDLCQHGTIDLHIKALLDYQGLSSGAPEFSLYSHQ